MVNPISLSYCFGDSESSSKKFRNAFNKDVISFVIIFLKIKKWKY
jgi:hypothetical protein